VIFARSLTYIISLLTSSIAFSTALRAEESPPCNKRPDSSIELCSISPTSGLFSAQTIAIKAPLSQYRIAVVRAQDLGTPRTTVKAMAASSKAAACINANFFDTRGAPLGLVIAGGRTYQKMHKVGSVLTGIFSVTRSGPEITHRDLFTSKDSIEAIQSGPRLIEKGVLTTGLKEGAAYSRRAATCLDSDGNIIFASSDAGIRGAPLNDFALTLKSSPLSCVDALNVDGGGSAQLFVSADAAQNETYVQGTDEVPVALCIFKRGFW
jgi:uncharacterized protein YigE (DUF2233 family)